MSADAQPGRRRPSGAIARRLGWVSAREHARLAAEVAALRDHVDAIERGLGQAIGELQEWNANQDRDLRRWSRELSERLRGLSAPRLETDRALFLAIDHLRALHERVGAEPSRADDATGLSGHELRAFSQHGEDGVVAEILRRIGAPERWFVEFGVETGREGNCVFLADVAGYEGLFIEADGHDFQELERKYADRDEVRTRQALVTPDSVERIFAEAGVPNEPAVLSIDVDGSDYWIWEAVEAYRPRLVIIEYNSLLPPERRLVQPSEHESGWDGTGFFGASLGAIGSLGERKGYRLVHVDLSALNAFLVREDLAAGRLPESADVARRGLPNYFHVGYRHPPDPHRRRYLDLDSGELVAVDPG